MASHNGLPFPAAFVIITPYRVKCVGLILNLIVKCDASIDNCPAFICWQVRIFNNRYNFWCNVHTISRPPGRLY